MRITILLVISLSRPVECFTTSTRRPKPAAASLTTPRNSIPGNDGGESGKEKALQDIAKSLDDYYDPSTNPSADGMTTDDMMKALGTSPRRILISLISATGIALVGNLFGITSALLQQFPEELVESTSLDTYYPRGDFKRFKSAEYTFVIPREWVADTAVELAKAQRRAQTLDLTMTSARRSSQAAFLPDSAFGPPGRLDDRGVSNSDTNVSVIRSSTRSDFTLSGTMKDPTEGALFLLDNSIAPEGSGRKATLISASEKDEVYSFEYRIDRERGVPLRSIAVLAYSKPRTTLYTLTVVAPNADWDKTPQYEQKLRKIAESFHIF